MTNSSKSWCTSCNIEISSLLEWRDHLLEKRHQSRARANWGITCSDAVDKNCCLVVNSHTELDKLWVINQFFSEDPCEAPPVKNLLCWDHLPKLTIVEFSSSEEARKGFKFSMDEIRESTFMEIKRAEDMSQTQWLSILPEFVAKRDGLGLAKNSSSSVAPLQDITSTHLNSESTRKRKLEEKVVQPSKSMRPVELIQTDKENAPERTPELILQQFEKSGVTAEAFKEPEIIKSLDEKEGKSHEEKSVQIQINVELAASEVRLDTESPDLERVNACEVFPTENRQDKCTNKMSPERQITEECQVNTLRNKSPSLESPCEFQPTNDNEASADSVAVDMRSPGANLAEAEAALNVELELQRPKSIEGSLTQNGENSLSTPPPTMLPPCSKASPEPLGTMPTEGEKTKNREFLLEKHVEHKGDEIRESSFMEIKRAEEMIQSQGLSSLHPECVALRVGLGIATANSSSSVDQLQDIPSAYQTSGLTRKRKSEEKVQPSSKRPAQQPTNEASSDSAAVDVSSSEANLLQAEGVSNVELEPPENIGGFFLNVNEENSPPPAMLPPKKDSSPEPLEIMPTEGETTPLTKEDKRNWQQEQTAAVELPKEAEMKLWTTPPRPSIILVLGRSEDVPPIANSPKSLSEVLAEGGWGKPKYKIVASKRNEAGKKVYFCRAFLNEKVWAVEYLKCESKKAAKIRIADQLRVNLLMKTPPAIQLLEKSRIPEMQSRLASGESVSSKSEAKTAVEGLNKIIVECSKVDENTVVILPSEEKSETEDDQTLLAAIANEEDNTAGADHSTAEPDHSIGQESLKKSRRINHKKRPVKMLQELAVAKGWSKPEHYSSRQIVTQQGHVTTKNKQRKEKSNLKTNRSSRSKQTVKSTPQLKTKREYSCRVVVNGVEYQPDPHSPRHQTRQKAISQIYLECLEKLSNTNICTEQKKQEGKGKKDDARAHESIHLNLSFPKSTSSPSRAQLEFQNLYNLVTQGNSKFEGAVEIVSALRRRLAKKRFSPCNVDLLRCCSFKSSSSNGPSVYIYNTAKASTQDIISTHEIDAIFQGDDNGQETFRVVKSPKVGKRKLWRVEHQSKQTRTMFSLIPIANDNLLEIQTNRLLEYLCNFDVRCQLLIVLAEYWASLNSIEIGEGSSENNSRFESLTLPYLVVFFLCRKGILPTPRDVQKQPHSTIIDPVSGEDVGFSWNPEFAQNWSSWNRKVKRMIPANYKEIGKNLTQKVLELFVDFLQFQRKGRMFSQEKFILNVRDTEWIKKQAFLESPPAVLGCMKYISNMTLKENKMLREFLLKDDDRSPVQDWTWPWHMTNPFVVTSKFPVSNKINCILYLMLESGRKVDKYLRLSSKINEKENSQSLQSALKICEMDKMVAQYEKKRKDAQNV